MKNLFIEIVRDIFETIMAERYINNLKKTYGHW